MTTLPDRCLIIVYVVIRRFGQCEPASSACDLVGVDLSGTIHQRAVRILAMRDAVADAYTIVYRRRQVCVAIAVCIVSLRALIVSVVGSARLALRVEFYEAINPPDIGVGAVVSDVRVCSKDKSQKSLFGVRSGHRICPEDMRRPRRRDDSCPSPVKAAPAVKPPRGFAGPFIEGELIHSPAPIDSLIALNHAGPPDSRRRA